MDVGIQEVLASLSLPKNSNAVSFDIGNSIKTQANDLSFDTETAKTTLEVLQKTKTLQLRALKEDTQQDYARVSYLLGMFHSISPIAKIYLGEGPTEERQYYASKLVGSLLLPTTQEERDVALQQLKDALVSVEKSAVESTKLTQKMQITLQNVEHILRSRPRPRKRPKPKPGPPPPPPEKSKAFLEMEFSERTAAMDILTSSKKEEGLELKLVSQRRVIGSHPKSIVEACWMMLFTKASDLDRSTKVENYTPAAFVAANMILHEPAEAKKTGFGFGPGPSVRRMRLFNVPLQASAKQKVIESIKNADPAHYRPSLELAIAQRKLSLWIPPLYVDPTTAGVGKWNRLIGIVVYLKITVKEGPATAPPEDVYVYVNGDFDHGYIAGTTSGFVQQDRKRLITLDSKTWRIGQTAFRWTEKEPLYAKLFKGKRWFDAKANVTRIYATTQTASIIYGRLQSTLQALSWRKSSLSLGIASAEKLLVLMSLISNETKNYPDIPIGLVLDLNIPRSV